jgi:Pentapeptide repeats (8 copies)
MTRSGQQTRSEAETAVRLPAELSQEKRPVEIAHNSFVKADLTGARFVGVSFYQNNFDGAILRDVIGLAHAVDVTKQLERDSKRTQELANLREEGLERLGCKDQNVNREKAAKLTEALDRKLSEGIEKGLDLTPRQILDNAIRSVLNENANPVNKNREKEQEQERIHTRARTSRGR